MLMAKSGSPMLSRRGIHHQGRVKKYLLENPQIEHVFIAACHTNDQENPLYEEELEKTIRYLLDQKKESASLLRFLFWNPLF